MPLSSTRLLSCVSLLLAPLVSAESLQYEAPLNQSSWQSQEEKHRCALNHQIPGFGLASFSRSAITGVEFSIEVQEATAASGEALLEAVPPAWQPDMKKKKFGVVHYYPGKRPFQFERELSLAMIAELERGMQITFYPTQWDAIPSMLSATLSTVNFRTALSEFRSCMAALPFFDYDELRNSMLLFETNSADLLPAAKQRLDRLVDYVRLDDGVSEVRIEGHTDNVSTRRYNWKLSRQRAEAVRDYLLEKQLPLSLFKLSQHGERKPRVSNRTASGRSQNRRVLVSIIK